MGKGNGYITLISEELGGLSNEIEFTMQAIKLENKDGWFSESDPFMEFSRVREDNTTVLVHRTEWYKNAGKNCKWRTFKISKKLLCGNDDYRPIRINTFDHENDGNHD